MLVRPRSAKANAAAAAAAMEAEVQKSPWHGASTKLNFNGMVICPSNTITYDVQLVCMFLYTFEQV